MKYGWLLGLLGLAVPFFAAAQAVDIDSIDPETPVLGNSVTVYGSGFTDWGNTLFLEGNGHQGEYLLLSKDGSTVDFWMPSYVPPGEYSIVISNRVGNVSSPFTFEAVPFGSPPTSEDPDEGGDVEDEPNVSTVVVSSVSPAEAFPGQEVVITGDGFTPHGNIIRLVGEQGQRASLIERADSPTELRFFAPGYIRPGVFELTVENAVGAKSSSVSFTIVQFDDEDDDGDVPDDDPDDDEDPVVISSVTPTTAGPGDFLSIKGSGFTLHGNRIFLRKGHVVEVSFVQSFDGETLEYFVPYLIEEGDYELTVENGNYVESSPVKVTIVREESEFCLFGFLFCKNQPAYVILGDSLAQGALAIQGYADRYEDFLEDAEDVEIDSRNFGRAGWTSADLADALSYDVSFSDNVSEAEYITWNIGGNDLRQAREAYKERRCGGADNEECLRQAVIEFRHNWDVIVEEILHHADDEALIRSMDLYNPFVAEDRAADTIPGDSMSDFQVFHRYFVMVNNHIHTSLDRRGIAYARVSKAFNGDNGLRDPEEFGYISADGYHPNDRGHAVIADLLADLYGPDISFLEL